MDHTDHVNLLREGGIASGQVWADMGAGTGAFTLALADLLGESGTIYAVDRDAGALRQQTTPMKTRFPQIAVEYITGDFAQPVKLPLLDGIVMANALHFTRYADQPAVLAQLRRYLHPGGRLIIVEYDTDQGNQWVPYPFTFPNWESLAAKAGFNHSQQIGYRPSRFARGIYSAVSW